MNTFWHFGVSCPSLMVMISYLFDMLHGCRRLFSSRCNMDKRLRGRICRFLVPANDGPISLSLG